ncbi:MAG: prepilin peptidase [Candidatus Absconditabacteria bacterium]
MIFGSLGSVLLERLQDKQDWKTIKSILIGRSQCPKCEHTLGRSELIPLASYIFQKGKCKHCKTHISLEYPILEIASALVFFVTFRALYHTNTNIIVLNEIPKLIFWIGTNWLLMLLIIHDIKKYELHMSIRILLMIRIRGRQSTGQIGNLKEAGIGLFICLLFFGGIYLFGKRYVSKRFHSNEEGFGQGDIFIGATLGSLFSLIGATNQIEISWIMGIKIVLILVILACSIGILYFIGAYFFDTKQKKKNQDDTILNKRIQTNRIIPFIPSLILAFWILLYKANLLLSFVF